MTEKYNGWTNYETWLVGLWLDNEQALYEEIRDMSGRAFRHVDEDNEEEKTSTLHNLSDEIKDYVENMIPENLPGFVSDLVNSALSEVNWKEIAEHTREE